MDLFNTLSRSYPELTLRIFETLGFDLFDLNYRVVSLLSPLKFFIEKIKHRKVQTPKVVSTRQIDVVMCVKTSERDSSAKVCVASLRHRLVLTVQVLLGKAEVHNEDLAILTI